MDIAGTRTGSLAHRVSLMTHRWLTICPVRADIRISTAGTVGVTVVTLTIAGTIIIVVVVQKDWDWRCCSFGSSLGNLTIELLSTTTTDSGCYKDE